MPSARTDYSTLVELLQDRAQSPEIAYIFLKDGETDSVVITYQELTRQALAIAVQLQSMNLSGHNVLIVYPYHEAFQFITAFLGCIYAGVVAVTCHPPRNQQGFNEIEDRLISSQAQVILTSQSLLSKLKNKSTIPNLLFLVTDNLPLNQATAWVDPLINENTLAFLQYTSGSTGKPKGVMITHKCLMYNQQLLKIAFGHGEKAVGVGWLPLFHDMGLIGNVLQALYLGRPCVLMSPQAFIQKPVRWLQAISRYQATTSGAPNFAYELLCHHVTSQERDSLDLSSWDVAFCGAEPVGFETLKRFVDKFAPCGFRYEACSTLPIRPISWNKGSQPTPTAFSP